MGWPPKQFQNPIDEIFRQRRNDVLPPKLASQIVMMLRTAKDTGEELAVQLVNSFEKEVRGIAETVYALKEILIEQFEEPKRFVIEEPLPSKMTDLPKKIDPIKDNPLREDRPSRDNEERRQRRLNWTKIGAIQPGVKGLNIIAKVLNVQSVGRKARVILGDETGIVKAFLSQNGSLTVGQTVVLFKAEAAVVQEHIEIQLMKRGKLEKAKREIFEANVSYDVSAKEWIPKV